MGKNIYEREYHRERLAKKYIRNHYSYLGGREYGLHKDYADIVNDSYRYYSHYRNRGRFYQTIWDYLFRNNLVSQDFCFEDIDFWQAEELDTAQKTVQAKKYLEEGSLKGHKRKKWIRARRNRQRRRKGKLYCNLVTKDLQDYADDTFDHTHRESYTWDIW